MCLCVFVCVESETLVLLVCVLRVCSVCMFVCVSCVYHL